RIDGRAVGGMAETILRRLLRPDEMLDDRLEPAKTCALRARCRATARRAYERPGFSRDALASLLGLPTHLVESAFDLPFFGRAWRSLEHAPPKLRRVRVPVSALPAQMLAAEAILRALTPAGGL